MTTRKSPRSVSVPANLSTSCTKISGVNGSFLVVLWASIRFAPASTCLMRSDWVGSSTNAIWWAQDMALTASSTGELVDDF